jgi:hypothetical protein
MMANETIEQSKVVDRLAKKGFTVSRIIRGNEPETVAVLMRKRPNSHTTLLAEVEADGSVNGQTVAEFLRRAK